MQSHKLLVEKHVGHYKGQNGIKILKFKYFIIIIDIRFDGEC